MIYLWVKKSLLTTQWYKGKILNKQYWIKAVIVLTRIYCKIWYNLNNILL